MFSNYLSITGLIGLLLLSCTGREKEMKLGNFRIDGELAGQTIPITDKVLMPLKIFASEDKILILDYTRKDVFKVMQLPGYEYLYSSGNIGEGPDDFINVNPESTCLKDGIFEFLDLGRVRRFALSNVGLSEIESFSLPTLSSPLNNLEKISDTVYIANTPVYSEDDFEHMIININSSEVGKRFGNFPKGNFKLSNQQEKHIAFHCISTANSSSGRLATFYTYFKRFKIYDESGDLIKEVVIRPNGEKQYLIKDNKLNIIHFAEPFSSGNYVYALYIGKSVRDLENYVEEYFPLLTIWDWDGNPIAQYQLNKPITSFTISEDKHRLYGISYLNMGEIYQFELPDSLFAGGMKSSLSEIRFGHYKSLMFSDWVRTFQTPDSGVLSKDDNLVYNTVIFADTSTSDNSSIWLNVIYNQNDSSITVADLIQSKKPYNINSSSNQVTMNNITGVGVVTTFSDSITIIDPKGLEHALEFTEWIWSNANKLFQIRLFTNNQKLSSSNEMCMIMNSFKPLASRQ